MYKILNSLPKEIELMQGCQWNFGKTQDHFIKKPKINVFI